MKKLLTCCLLLLAALLLLTTGALAFDSLNPPQPGAAEGWYVTDETYSLLNPSDQTWGVANRSHHDYEFNDAGLAVKDTETTSGTEDSSVFVYEYDAQGRVLRSSRDDGNHITAYDYRDDGSHLQTYTWWDDGAPENQHTPY